MERKKLVLGTVSCFVVVGIVLGITLPLTLNNSSNNSSTNGNNNGIVVDNKNGTQTVELDNDVKLDSSNTITLQENGVTKTFPEQNLDGKTVEDLLKEVFDVEIIEYDSFTFTWGIFDIDNVGSDELSNYFSEYIYYSMSFNNLRTELYANHDENDIINTYDFYNETNVQFLAKNRGNATDGYNYFDLKYNRSSAVNDSGNNASTSYIDRGTEFTDFEMKNYEAINHLTYYTDDDGNILNSDSFYVSESYFIFNNKEETGVDSEYNTRYINSIYTEDKLANSKYIGLASMTLDFNINSDNIILKYDKSNNIVTVNYIQ